MNGMIIIVPPTPITVEDRVDSALAKVDQAIERYKVCRVNALPLWSKLHDIKIELRLLQVALKKSFPGT